MYKLNKPNKLKKMGRRGLMIIPIKKIILEAIQRHTYNQNNIEMSPEDHIRNTNNLYKNLNQFSKEYNIPKKRFGGIW